MYQNEQSVKISNLVTKILFSSEKIKISKRGGPNKSGGGGCGGSEKKKKKSAGGFYSGAKSTDHHSR